VSGFGVFVPEIVSSSCLLRLDFNVFVAEIATVSYLLVLNNSLEEFLLSSCIVDDLLSDFSDSDSD
jgi:hypothetical protein